MTTCLIVTSQEDWEESFDYLSSKDWEADAEICKDVGRTFIKTYKKIIKDTVELPGTKMIKPYSFIGGHV